MIRAVALNWRRFFRVFLGVVAAALLTRGNCALASGKDGVVLIVSDHLLGRFESCQCSGRGGSGLARRASLYSEIASGTSNTVFINLGSNFRSASPSDMVRGNAILRYLCRQLCVHPLPPCAVWAMAKNSSREGARLS